MRDPAKLIQEAERALEEASTIGRGEDAAENATVKARAEAQSLAFQRATAYAALATASTALLALDRMSPR